MSSDDYSSCTSLVTDTSLWNCRRTVGSCLRRHRFERKQYAVLRLRWRTASGVPYAPPAITSPSARSRWWPDTNSQPIVKEFELDAAVRYDHYNLSGGKASPKIGFRGPDSRFACAGLRQRFRAPGPAENGQAAKRPCRHKRRPILCCTRAITTPGNFVASAERGNSGGESDLAGDLNVITGIIVNPSGLECHADLYRSRSESDRRRRWPVDNSRNHT